MKTPEEWRKERAHWSAIDDCIIAEIQRDAREGMVPVEDVRPLLAELRHPVSIIAPHIEALRAKHPNLFTK